MARDSYQQTYDLLGKGKNVLIVAGHKEIKDSYPAAIGLAGVLERNKKKTTLFSSAEIPDNFHFLGDKYLPQKNITGAQDIIVSVNTLQNSVKQISYRKNGSHLNIHISPGENSRLGEEDVHVKLGKFNYDLVVTIGLDDLESLKEHFHYNASLFFETPVINIDKSSSNERYGEVNIIEPTSSSCSEITTNILKDWDENLIDRKSATALLAGIISATNNFQNKQTRPGSLFASAYLMSREGEQQEIIKNIFKTKSFGFLKLCGTAMNRMRLLEDKKIGWLSLEQKDFEESQSTPKTIPLVLEELKNNFSQAEIFIVFWKNQHTPLGLVHADYEEQLAQISKLIPSQQHGKNLIFNLAHWSEEERQKVVESVYRAIKI